MELSRKEVIRQRLAKLERELELLDRFPETLERELELLDRFPETDEDLAKGTVIRFTKKFNRASGEEYTYAAIHAAGLWYITGTSENRSVDWSTLCEVMADAIDVTIIPPSVGIPLAELGAWLDAQTNDLEDPTNAGAEVAAREVRG